jgi:signal transduction histidine kinase
VDIITADDRIERLALVHVDPAKVQLARKVRDDVSSESDAPATIRHVIRYQAPIMGDVPTGALIRSGRAAEYAQIAIELGVRSFICLPLISSGRTLGAITLAYAESERRYTESDLRFCQEVASRAALAIENARAYREAYEANRLKDEFLATLSHELRTPLNAILGYAQMLSMRVLDAERQSRAIEVLTRNAEALSQMIDDVLDVSRITAGKVRLNVQAVDLVKTIGDAVATIQPAADAKGVSLLVIADPIIPRVSGDPDRLQQVVWNLLSNAVKFTPRGGRIQLRVDHVDSHVQMAVSDTGQGVKPEFLPHIFERFRQADSRFSREHGGLGLGLSIVRELVELHGGGVWATSDGPGKGATFWVRLPVLAAEPQGTVNADLSQHHRGASSTLVAASSPARRLDGVRVLAVDDQEDALGLLRAILESAGAQVSTVESGPAALAFLEAHTTDVVIADIGMPLMDGLELIRTIRKSPLAGLKSLPAAALTAYARPADRVDALANGFQMHLTKPVNPILLLDAVAFLSGRS